MSEPPEELDVAAEAADVVATPAREEAVLTEDVPCRHCGYNLRGLLPGANCPECNTAIALSIVGNSLASASPEWLAKLVRGIGIFFWAKLATVGIGIMWFVFFRRTLDAEIWQGASLMMQALMVLGTWLFTTPDPGELIRSQGVSMRQVARVAAVCTLSLSAAEFCSGVLPLPDEARMPVAIGLRVLSLVGVVAVASRLLFLSKLAERLPDYRLARRARFLAIVESITDGLVLVGSLAALLVVRLGRPDPGVLIAIGCSMGIIGLAMLVFFIMELILIMRMKNAVKNAMYMAQVRWEGIRRPFPGGAGGPGISV